MLIDLWQWNIAETRAVYVFHVGGVDRWESVISGEGRGRGERAGPPRAAKWFRMFSFLSS